jgi:hypothetical protein
MCTTLPALATQVIAIGTLSTRSAPFNAATRILRIYADARCSIQVGDPSSVGAGVSNHLVPPGLPEFISVPAGSALAVVDNP